MKNNFFLRMKKLHTVILLFLVFNLNYSQIVIGANSLDPFPSYILDIQSATKGLLLPRLETRDQESIETPAIGLLIYNTDVNTFTYSKPLDGSFTWENITTFNTPQATQYTGNVRAALASRQNLNEATTTNVPILSNNILNFDEGETLYSIDEDDHTLTINQDGRYRMIINISMRFGNISLTALNIAPEMWISVERDGNDIQLGTFSSTALFDTDIYRTEGSLNITEVFNLFKNDVISIKTNLSANSGKVVLKRPSNVSSIYIEKIR